MKEIASMQVSVFTFSKTVLLLVAMASILALQGCAITNRWAYSNSGLEESAAAVQSGLREAGKKPKASFEIQTRSTKKQPKVLVLLAFSGGGSRAAYFAARTMFELERIPGPRNERINVLEEVDLISSVSGGSLAAAYYASTCDPDSAAPALSCRSWDEKTVAGVMGRNYIKRWLGNWFWPSNALRFWFSPFDRTDIMAQTFADNLFDRQTTGADLHMHDLNPARPNIVLNATVGSRDADKGSRNRSKLFGTAFTFTQEDFADKLHSDIAAYEIARAVMATATFPGVFNYMTLRNFHALDADCARGSEGCYLHVFDGGNADNLGLVSLKRVLLSHNAKYVSQYERIVVISVDAFRRPQGVESSKPDPRNAYDYIVDTNFLDSSDSLLKVNRERILQQFFARNLADYSENDGCGEDNLPEHACILDTVRLAEVKEKLGSKLFFFHVAFDALENPQKQNIRDKLHAIPTTFLLEQAEMEVIEQGAAGIFTDPGNVEAAQCVRRLGEIIASPESTSPIVENNTWCGGHEMQAQRKARLLK
jgi:predicted acylesterase/phospholipase RssA